VRALEQVHEAARAAEEARAEAERTRSALDATSAACEEAASRSARVAALQAQVPRQNSGPADDTATDEALLDAVAAARSAWDAAPVPPPLDGPCSRQLRTQLAELAAGDGVDPEVRE